MFFNKKAFVALLFLLMGAQFAHAQSFSDRVVFHRGFFLGLMDSPRSARILQDTSGVDSSISVSAKASNIQFGLNWGTSIMLFELDQDRSVRLGASLAASAFIPTDISSAFDLLDVYTGYALQIPLTVNYYQGHLATKYATKDFGFNVGFGVEINRLLFILDDYDENSMILYRNGRFERDQKNFVQPVLNMGFSYWNNNELARTVNFQVGFGNVFEFYGESYTRPSFRLSLHKYINY